MGGTAVRQGEVRGIIVVARSWHGRWFGNSGGDSKGLGKGSGGAVGRIPVMVGQEIEVEVGNIVVVVW